jgi:hypothetical protein
MKKLITGSLTVLMILLLSQCGPTQDEAIEYHEKIIHEQHLVVGYVNQMIGSFSTAEIANIETALNAAIEQVNKSIEVLEGMEMLEGGDHDLLKYCLELFRIYKSQLENEYTEQLNIYKIPIKDLREEDNERFNELNDLIDEVYYPAFDRFSKAEEEFATQWDFELLPADL